MGEQLIDPNLDPDLAKSLSAVLAAAADLATARIHLENYPVSEIVAPVLVDAEFLENWAARPDVSPEFQNCARQVAAGRNWEDIESWAKPLPPELLEMKNSRNYRWTFPDPAAISDVGQALEVRNSPIEERPPVSRERVVGPSDWPEDFDDYPRETSWLV